MKIQYVILDENMSFDSVAAYASLLPPYRQEKIARYRFDRDKLLSLAAGLLLRREIGDRPILFGEHDKPYVADKGLRFSLSHSDRIAAIAVDTEAVGMDVERIPDEDRLKIADRFYHANERAYVQRSQDPRRAFCEIWTRKEAYLKMTGEGISTDLTAFDTTGEPLNGRLYTIGMDGYCLSVCSGEPMCADDVYISELELKDLI